MGRLIDADALKAKLKEGLEHYQYRPDDFANSFGLCIEEWQKEQEAR